MSQSSDQITESTSRSDSQPNPKRSWFQFGTRSLMVLTFVAAIFFVWLGYKFKQAERQRQIVEKYRALLMYDYEVGYIWSNLLQLKNSDPQAAEPPSPKWMIDLCGVDFFCSVVTVHLDENWSPENPVEQLSEIAELRDLGSFTCYAPITDAQIKPFANHPTLNTVVLREAHITDKGLATIGTLKALVFLHLQNAPQISGSGLKEFEFCDNIRTLHFHSCHKMSNESMKHIARCQHLYRLELWECPIGNEGLKHLTTLQELEYLHPGNNITEEGFHHFAEFANLKVISLEGCKPSEQVIKELLTIKPMEFHFSLTEMDDLSPFKEATFGHSFYFFDHQPFSAEEKQSLEDSFDEPFRRPRFNWD